MDWLVFWWVFDIVFVGAFLISRFWPWDYLGRKRKR